MFYPIYYTYLHFCKVFIIKKKNWKMGIICLYYTVSKSLDERICVDNNVLTIHMVSWSLWAKNGEIEQLIIYGSGNGYTITY